SFNMGVSRKTWETVGGFTLTRLGEDIEYSIRIQSAGLTIGLIPEAVVYHKRRTDFKQFYKQLHFFGRARINIYKHFPAELKLVHFFPALFVLFLSVLLLLNLYCVGTTAGTASAVPMAVCRIGNLLLASYALLILLHALWRLRHVYIALLSVVASFIQLIAYGLGFIQDDWKRVIRR